MADVVGLLSELIAFPTHHATRPEDAGDELAMCRHLAPLLAARGADEVEVVETGRATGGPGGYVVARWGTPRLLVNAHLDTVPANSGWSRDPWTPTIEGDRLYGLGSCDTKGAIAAALCAAERARPRDVALLFSGDEERGTAAVHHFLGSARRPPIERAIVCEPTARQAGVAHRGVLASRATIRGVGGHSSRADHLPAPIVTMARLATMLGHLGTRFRELGPAAMPGVCMNVAALEGGVAFNVIPTEASLLWSIRPWPGFDRAIWDDLIAGALTALATEVTHEVVLDHAPFAGGGDELRRLVGGHAAGFVGLDFWTEAALYQEAGIDAIVIGPGDIAQAHAADEYVTLADLAWAVDLFTAVFEAHGG